MRVSNFLRIWSIIAALAWPIAPIQAEPQASKPVRHDVFQELPVNAIRPDGWLKEFLQRQNSGMTGHREVLSYPYDTCLWAGTIPRKGNHGMDWWRYEQTAYLCDGILRLGYLLNDEKLIKTGREGVDYLLANPLKNDRLGHACFSSQWPMAVYFRVLQAEYLATRNPLLLEAMRKHYLSYSVDDLTKKPRHVVNLEGLLWTYGQTGDAGLLELAEKASKSGRFPGRLGSCVSLGKTKDHGVTFNEEAKLPAIFYIYTGNKEYLNASVNAFKKIDQYHMLPDGVPSSNEFLSDKNPITSHETCDISDYTWSIGYLLMASGDATWADRLERAIFNAGPGAVSKDFKNLQYFSSVNQVLATGSSNDNDRKKDGKVMGPSRMAYWTCHDTECCAGSVHRFMPNYAARMWMQGRDGGLVAALYGPSKTEIVVNDGKDKLSVIQSTNYPFSDTITFTFNAPRPVATSFSFRTPVWCAKASATVNGAPYDGKLTPGEFTLMTRTFKDGDTIVLRFPMEAKLQQHENYGVYVERGPLLFAYAVPETVTVDTKEYESLGGKKTSDPVNFPALDLQPAGPWNYALAVKSADDLKVTETKNDSYPLDPGAGQITIKVPAKKVKGWVLNEGRFTPPLPIPGKFECESETEIITLVPYGSTRLRVSVFPVVQ